MRQTAHMLLFALLSCLTLVHGCAYSIYDDQRLMDTQSSDKALASNIKAALLKSSFSEGWDISVYCYYGHVFLVGQAPDAMRRKAVVIAERHNPISVTAHWFPSAAKHGSDFSTGARLRTALIGTKGLASTRVDTEVNAGRAVLLGVVADEHERQIAVRAARHVEGITSVTSYLLLPQKAGRKTRATPATVPGTAPERP